MCDFKVIIWLDLEEYSTLQGPDITELQYLSRVFCKSDYLSVVAQHAKSLKNRRIKDYMHAVKITEMHV